jgi:tRNA(Ile)-lysidine synthase
VATPRGLRAAAPRPDRPGGAPGADDRRVRAPAADAAVHAVRRAVREAFTALEPPVMDAPPLVACSGGADSLALVAACVAERPGGPPVHAVVVDHGLQPGSAERAHRTVELLVALGAEASVRPVRVTGPGGLEAAARRARYAALRAARPARDSPVLLGHTLDDQAETVLLGLGRGSGPRSIAGMRVWDPPWLRPLLDLPRTLTRAACRALELPVWDDPHNTDARFTRVRLRHEVLPLLEDVLAGGVAAALARTAAQLREDCDALDALADGLLRTAVGPGPVAGGRGTAGPVAGGRGTAGPGTAQDSSGAAGTIGGDLRVAPLTAAPAAVRRRVLRAWLLAAGVTGLTDGHLRAADALVGAWRGQGGVALPGGLDVVRERGRLLLRPGPW